MEKEQKFPKGFEPWIESEIKDGSDGLKNAFAYYASADSDMKEYKDDEARAKYKIAIELYCKMLASEPENYLVHNYNGCAYYKMREYKKAAEQFSKAIGLKPDYLMAIYNRGLANHCIGEYQRAIEDYSIVIGVRPFTNVFYLAGIAYETIAEQHKNDYEKNIDNAEQNLKKALQITSDFEDAKKIKGELEFMQAKEKKAGENSIMREEQKSNPINFSNIPGMAKLKEFINSQILYPLKHKERAGHYGKRFGGGLLLYGPPGCGKSTIAEAIAGEAGIKVIRANPAELLNIYVGNSEKNLALLFEEARGCQPSLILFDGLETIAGRREEMSLPLEKSLTNQFILEMDRIERNGEQILVIGITNLPWRVDDAIRRSGRFNHVVLLEAPDLETRIEIFRCSTDGLQLNEEVVYEELALLTEGLSCANIKSICAKVTENALKEEMETGNKRKITMKDFISTIDKEQSDIIEWAELVKKYAEKPAFKERYIEMFRYADKITGNKRRENFFDKQSI